LYFLFVSDWITKRYVSTFLGNPSPLCVWRSSRQLSMQLGFGLASSTTISLDLSPGIAGGLFQSTTGSTPASAVLAPAAPPQLPQPPVVLVSGPSSVATCATSFSVSAEASVALSLFASPSFVWTATPTTPALNAAIAASAGFVCVCCNFVFVYSRVGGAQLVVASVDLVPGVLYVITASTGGVSSSHVVQLATSTQRVAVRVTGPSQVSMYSWSELILEAQVLVCGTGVYYYAWTKISGPAITLNRATQVTNTYRIAPNALTAGTYQFQVSVDLNDNLDTVGRATVNVTVLSSSLVALPTGQQVDTRLRDVTIDGSASQDADSEAAVASYSWQCLEQAFPASPCVVSSILSASAATARGVVDFPTANLAPGPWSFSLIFSKGLYFSFFLLLFLTKTGARRARAFQTVTVDWNEAPTGRLQLRDPNSLQIVGVGSPASATNLFNAREPLVVFAGDVRVEPSSMASWSWSASSGLSLAGASGTAGAYLFLPPLTFAPAAGFVLTAVAKNSNNFSSTMQFVFAGNDEPRTVLPGSGCLASAPSLVVTALSTVVTVSCQGWTDDGNHYPLGYLFRSSDGFLLSTGFGASSVFEFVLPSAQTAAVAVQVRDALGAWSELVVPLPLGSTVVPAFGPSGDAAVIAGTAQSLINVQLRRAVEVGYVERIDQIGRGVMLGLTSVSTGTTDALQMLRRQWTSVVETLEKYVVQEPTLLWTRNQGDKIAVWTRNSLLLDAELQNISLTQTQMVFALFAPGTAKSAPGWVSVFSNVLAASNAQPLLANVSQQVSYRFVNASRFFLRSQVIGGAAVPHSTVAASYSATHISMISRLDTFGTCKSLQDCAFF
jgi:hypothetical protein